MDVRLYGDEILGQRSVDVPVVDGKVRELVGSMAWAMYKAEGLALAAPQVGRLLRLFIYDMRDGRGLQVVINPRLQIERNAPTKRDEEGCLSLPGMYFPLARARLARIAGIDLDGNPIDERASGLKARMFQHETDHLKGFLFIDRLSRKQRESAVLRYEKIRLERDATLK